MDLQPIAVMLQLVRPTRTGGRFLGDSRLTRMNESSGRVQWPAARVTPQHAADIMGRPEKMKTRFAVEMPCDGHFLPWLTAPTPPVTVLMPLAGAAAVTIVAAPWCPPR